MNCTQLIEEIGSLTENQLEEAKQQLIQSEILHTTWIQSTEFHINGRTEILYLQSSLYTHNKDVYSQHQETFEEMMMEELRRDAVADIHRAMVVLMEELEMKNMIIMKLRSMNNGVICQVSVQYSMSVTDQYQAAARDWRVLPVLGRINHGRQHYLPLQCSNRAI